MIHKLFCLLILGISFNFAMGQTSTNHKAELSIKRDGEMVKITGIFINNSKENLNLSYNLKIERKGKTGTSSSNQSGKFSAKAGEKTELSSSSINISEGDTYTFYLTITDEKGKIIAEEELTEEDK